MLPLVDDPLLEFLGCDAIGDRFNTRAVDDQRVLQVSAVGHWAPIESVGAGRLAIFVDDDPRRLLVAFDLHFCRPAFKGKCVAGFTILGFDGHFDIGRRAAALRAHLGGDGVI